MDKKTPADLIIKGDTIYTVESAATVAAVTIKGDTIIYARDLAAGHFSRCKISETSLVADSR